MKKHKKLITALLSILLLFGALVIYSFSSMHTHRNRLNVFPQGALQQIGNRLYMDEAQQTWILQAHSENIFHQPSKLPLTLHSKYYANIHPSPLIDSMHPNIKLLCELPNGSSYEAILQPNNTYLNKGPKQGTYNYSHPISTWGKMKHIILDVAPHFINDRYTPTPMD